VAAPETTPDQDVDQRVETTQLMPTMLLPRGTIAPVGTGGTCLGPAYFAPGTSLNEVVMLSAAYVVWDRGWALHTKR
jgi:hypothetical protein